MSLKAADQANIVGMPIEITVEAILSDMDGTLVDSTPAVESFLGSWAERNGIAREVFFAVSHGVRTRDNIRRFQTVPKPGSEMTEEELDEEVRQLENGIAQEGARLAAEGGRGITILPGVEKFLDRLREGAARWGIVTSATIVYATSALTTSKIGHEAPRTPFLITADKVSQGKPHPEPYLAGIEAARKLEGPPINPANVLVLEDAPSGLASGLAAGCRTLALCTGQTRERIKATEATYKCVDLERVEVVSCSPEGITLRIKTLDEEDD